MQRVLVIGPPGSGKSTLAPILGEATGLPVVHLDCLFWNPGWVQTPRDKWSIIISEVISQDRWIIDGSYSSTLKQRLSRADTVIHLDFPRWICMLHIFKRILKGWGRTRPDMAPGCPEKLDLEFLKWSWNYFRNQRPGILRALSESQSGSRIEVITLKSKAEVRLFCRDLLHRS